MRYSASEKIEIIQENQVNFHKPDRFKTGKEKYVNQLIQSTYDESLYAKRHAKRQQW